MTLRWKRRFDNRVDVEPGSDPGAEQQGGTRASTRASNKVHPSNTAEQNQQAKVGAGPGVLMVTSAANRLIDEVVQSWRRPLLEPSPG